MIDAAFFTANRHSLTKKLRGGVVVLSAHAKMQQVNDMAYKFTQESNFWYLCGIQAAGWRLVIDGSSGRSTLIVPELDEVHRTFDGELSVDDAKHCSGVDAVITYDEGQRLLRTLSRIHTVVYTVDHPSYISKYDFSFNPAVAANKKALSMLFQSVVDCRKELSALRAIKQHSEISAIEKAIALTTTAFKQCRDNITTYKYEYEVEADFTHLFKRHHGSNHAYEPIVASGINACTLHYVENTAKLTKKSMLLLDIGACVDGYAADISRTYAIGAPTKRQQEVHAAVEHAHYEIISLLGPDLSVELYQKTVDDIMSTALKKLKLYKDESSLRRYFPHAVSHGLGIDVHDSLGAPQYFKTGMVLTVEPGIYIPEEAIGVRIEDDIHITEKGRVNLSKSLSTGL